VLRPKLDYLAFRRDGGGVRYRTDSILLMADYNYYLTEEREGAYLIGGLGLHHTRRDVSRNLLVPGTATADVGTTGLAYNLGLGLALSKNAALELKYLGMDMNALKYKQPGVTEGGFMGNGVVLSLSYTF
jgi:opacity protein-like surface antigen